MAESVFHVGDVEKQIEELNDHIVNLVKSDTLSGMTSSSGNISTSVSASGKVLLSAVAGYADVVIPYVNSSGYIAFHVCYPSLEARTETNVSIVYYYI